EVRSDSPPLFGLVEVELMSRAGGLRQPGARHAAQHVLGRLRQKRAMFASNHERRALDAFPFGPVVAPRPTGQSGRDHVEIKRGPPAVFALLKSIRPRPSRQAVAAEVLD